MPRRLMPRGPFPHGQGAYLGRGHGGRHDLAGVIEQLPGQERHLPAAADDPAAAGEPSRARRAQELHVQVGGGREQARAQRGHQRRAQGVVEHRRQEPALDRPGGVQELLPGGERDLDRAGLGIDCHQFPREQDGRGQRRGPAFHHIPERALARHPAIPVRDRRHSWLGARMRGGRADGDRDSRAGPHRGARPASGRYLRDAGPGRPARRRPGPASSRWVLVPSPSSPY